MAEQGWTPNGRRSNRKSIEKIQDDIVRYAGRPDRRNTANILLIGKSGAGKSAFVNTLVAALTGEYFQKAKVGKGSTQSKTKDIMFYKNCGLIEEDGLNHTASRWMKRLIPKLPNIIDTVGLGDDNTPELREILKLLIEGRVPPGTSISTLQRMQNMGNLSSNFSKSVPAWKVTTIVYVQSAVNDVPVNLIQCLNEVIDEVNHGERTSRYTGDVLVAVTRYDLVKSEDEHENDIEVIGKRDEAEEESSYIESQKQDEVDSLTMSEFEKIEQKVAKHLNLEGTTQFNIIRWVNYNDHVGFERNSNIDEIALKFLKRAMAPSVPEQSVPWYMELFYFLNNTEDENNGRRFLKIVVAVIFVAVILYALFWLVFYIGKSPEQHHSYRKSEF